MDDRLRVTPAVGLTVYRVVQEALTNVTRHGGRRPRARVDLSTVGPAIIARVTNTGPFTASNGSGKGLNGMRDRVAEIGRASCRERAGRSAWISGGAVSLKKKKK